MSKGMGKVGGIGWAEFAWNPVSGCLHPCRNTYCYNTHKKLWLNQNGARVHVNNVRPNDVTEPNIYNNSNFKCIRNWRSRETRVCHEAQPGEVYPYGYDPTFYPQRLKEPINVKHPPKVRVFVVDVGDLFGGWIRGEYEKWIDQILDVVKECERLHYKYIFYFLSKNPIKYHSFTLPDNVWIGTSIDDNATAVKRYNDLIGYNNSKVNRFISFEPLLQDINMNSISLEKIDWVIIGANSIPGASKPPQQWANNIMAQARSRNIPVFIKDNYGYPTSIKESPSRRNGVDIMHNSNLDSRYRNIFKVGKAFYDQSYKDMKTRIKTNGFDSIPIIHVWGNYIILGHLSFEVAVELGFKEVPVKRHPFPSQKEAFDYARNNKDPRVEMNI